MENIMQNLINVLNILAQISTKGDDTVRMGSVLVELRRIINELEQNPDTAEGDNDVSSADLQ